MSDELDENRPREKTKESDFEKNLKQGPVSPVNEDVYGFLVNLYADEGDYPERIEVRTIKGRNKDQYGIQIKQYLSRSTSTKPTNERLVMMANEIVHRCKIHTDTAQKPMTFMIGAMHHARSDDFYEIMTLDVRPSKKWKNGESGAEGEDEDGEFSGRYNIAMLGHFTQFFGLIGGMMEGLIDRSDRQAQASANDAERVRARYIELLEANLKLVQADDERTERRERSQMWRKNIDKGLDMAWNLLPPMVGALTNKNGSNAGWVPGTKSSESYTLSQFFKRSDEGGKLQPHEFEIIFGKIEEGKPFVPGVLSPQQGEILGNVAQELISPDQLDLLLPGGVLEITQEQIMTILQAGVSMEVLAPLKLLFDVRLAKKQQAQQQNLNGKGA